MRLVTRCVRRLTPRATPRGALRAVASVVGFVHLQRRSLTVCLPVAFPACSPQVTMVKQKIHTARNQTVKAHRNGIKKPKRQRYRSTKGVRLCDVMPWRCCGGAVAVIVHWWHICVVLCCWGSRADHSTSPSLSFAVLASSAAAVVIADGPALRPQRQVRQEAQQEGPQGHCLRMKSSSHVWAAAAASSHGQLLICSCGVMYNA